MSLISVAKLAFQFPSTGFLFQDLTLAVNPGDRIAITGHNGCGKTTLLMLLEGALDPTSGTIVRRTGLVFAKAAQNPPSDGDLTLLDFVFQARPRLNELRRRLVALQAEDPVEYAAALNEYAVLGGFAAESEPAKILNGLGFSAEECSLPLGSLSAGQRRRAALARALHSEADVLLLDEPTNHLDAAGRKWLAEELRARGQACVLVSHDRAMLRAFATRVVSINRRTSMVFEGGYDAWREADAIMLRQAWADYDAAQRRKAAAEAAAHKRADLARKVAAPPPGVKECRDFYARKAAKVARTGRMLRERAEEEEKIDKPWEEQSIPRLTFDNVPRAGDFPLRASGLAKSYGGRLLFREFHLQLSSRARVAITGANGAGKTTLLRILAGVERADTGTVTLSAGARKGMLLQDTAPMDLGRTPLALCGSTTLARTLMGCLKLRPDCVNRPLLELSPGERAKTSLVGLLASGANLLLLDEPTEHLEIEAQEALEQALREYPGAIVVISHDMEFLNALGPEVEIVQLADYSAPVHAA